MYNIYNMKYLKNYNDFNFDKSLNYLFEGFKDDELDKLIFNNKTSVIKKTIKDYKNISNDISKYNISNFEYELKNNHYIIKPDIEFLKIYRKYCIENNYKPIEDLNFIVSILPKSLTGELNIIDVQDLIPKNLRGLSLGYKIYKFILNKVNFIMTNKFNTLDAKNLWYNILKDKDVFSGTNENYNIIIDKNISDYKLKEILENINKFNFIFDNELNDKINKLNNV